MKRCSICGSTDNLELDHIIPKSKGGTDDSSNLQWLCKTHNRQKLDKISYYNSEKKIIKEMIIDSLNRGYRPYSLPLDPIKEYGRISKVVFILPKDFYEIFKDWEKDKKENKELQIKEPNLEPSYIKAIFDYIKTYGETTSLFGGIGSVSIEGLRKFMKKNLGLNEEKFNEILEKLLNEGLIFKPASRRLMLVR